MGTATGADNKPLRYEVSDDDVRNVFHRVVAHRLRVRNGPSEEVKGSLLTGLPEFIRESQRQRDVDGNGEKTKLVWTAGRRTVGEILREILEVV